MFRKLGHFHHITRSVGATGQWETSCECSRKAYYNNCLHSSIIENYYEELDASLRIICPAEPSPLVQIICFRRGFRLPYICVLSVAASVTLDYRHASHKRTIVKLLPSCEWSCSGGCRKLRLEPQPWFDVVNKRLLIIVVAIAHILIMHTNISLEIQRSISTLRNT